MTTRDLLRRGALLSLLCLGALAPAAHANLNSWSSLSGLTASSKANWVRVYATGTPPTTMYAGTEGDGVYKSIDDGLTWVAYNNSKTSHVAGRAFYFTGGNVLMATDSGLFQTADTVSTSGAAWVPVAQGAETDPDNPVKLNDAVETLLPVSGRLLAGTFSEGVYTSSDKGQTWSPPPANNGMPEGTTVWSLTSFASFVWAATSEGIYRSSDGGSTWTLSSDGIPFDVTLGVFQDTQNPLIYYAETASSGLYRSIDGGATWQSANGDPNGEDFGGGGTPTIHGITEFSGQTQTRLYTATSDGMWVGTLPNVTVPGTGGKSLEVPGTPIWRQVTTGGLGNNTIMWTVSNFTNVPGTLLVGTQSNGGYSLTFQPPSNDGQSQDLPSWLAAPLLALKVGTTLIGTSGNWNGTPQIDYSYQWQRCTSTNAGSCTDIANADNKDYTLVKADQGNYIRVEVTASNDFPSFGLAKAYSAIRGTVAQAPGPLPGSNQESAPSIDVTPSDDEFLPQEGDTLSAPPQSQDPSGWLLNPAATSVSYVWTRCDANGKNCQDIAGATDPTYTLTAADDGLTLRVQVTGENANGSTILPLSGPTNNIIPLPAKDIDAPTIAGTPYVGTSLVGSVGTWASSNTYWSRQWMQCEPDGSDCSPIQGATSPTYVVSPDDLGMRLELEVTADVNPADQLPDPVTVDTAPTGVVTNPPSGPGGGTPGGGTPGGGTPGGGTPGGGNPDGGSPGGGTPSPVPSVGKLTLIHKGSHVSLSFPLSGPGGAIVSLERPVKGHRAHTRCVSGRRKHAKACTAYKVMTTWHPLLGAAQTVTVALPTKLRGHKLPTGHYILAVTPYSSTGKAGSTRTLKLVLVGHKRRLAG
jgi:hypothetical protein